MQIEVVVCAAPEELVIREQLRLFSAECVSHDRIRDNHDFLVKGSVEQFVRRSRPNRETTPVVRNLPLSLGARKSAYVNLERSRLARLICDPSSVWRKYRIRVDKRAGPKNRRFTRLPAGFLIPFHWNDHDIRPSPRTVFLKEEEFFARVPGSRCLQEFRVGELLNVSTSISSLPVDVLLPVTGGSKCDPFSVRRPNGKAVDSRIECQSRHRVALPVVKPNVTLDPNRYLTSIGRKVRASVSRKSQAQWRCLTRSIHPIHGRVYYVGSRKIHRCTVVGKCELSTPVARNRADAFQDWDSLASRLHPNGIEE